MFVQHTFKKTSLPNYLTSVFLDSSQSTCNGLFEKQFSFLHNVHKIIKIYNVVDWNDRAKKHSADNFQ